VIPQQWNIILFLCCSGVLLIAEVVSRFQKIGSFVRKLRKLGFELENKVDYDLHKHKSKFVERHGVSLKTRY